jgi:hypothetical protein
MKTFKELLENIHACREAREWAADKTIEEVVEQCDRGDWLMWLAQRLDVEERSFILAKAHCANTVRHLVKDARVLPAIDTAFDYAADKATIDDVRASVASVSSIDNSHYECSEFFASYAARIDSACAAYAACAFATAYAAATNKKETADICRKYIGQEIIGLVNQILNQ